MIRWTNGQFASDLRMRMRAKNRGQVREIPQDCSRAAEDEESFPLLGKDSNCGACMVTSPTLIAHARAPILYTA